MKFGTPLAPSAVKLLLLGSGELGKEVVIEAQRFGVEVIAVDRYPNAPAMQVAHRSYVINMLDADALREIIQQEQPDFIVPEIEAIATDVLAEIENNPEFADTTVIPNARATQLTMNREGIRRLAAEEVGVTTSPYRFADSEEECLQAAAAVGFPCVIKPVMSSSGKGQRTIGAEAEVADAWAYAQSGGRAGGGRVIVEGFIEFDYEITLLTVRHKDGTVFCEPIGHYQVDGDYRESWQPQPMSNTAREESQRVAKVVTDALGGNGLFGVELFIKGDEVIFSEVSPRPHDTGMVTMISQDLSEFALHVRAILGLPIPLVQQFGPSASCVILAEGNSSNVAFQGVSDALSAEGTSVRLFGKPEVTGRRRMGVTLARGNTIDEAREKARQAAEIIKVEL